MPEVAAPPEAPRTPVIETPRPATHPMPDRSNANGLLHRLGRGLGLVQEHPQPQASVQENPTMHGKPLAESTHENPGVAQSLSGELGAASPVATNPKGEISPTANIGILQGGVSNDRVGIHLDSVMHPNTSDEKPSIPLPDQFGNKTFAIGSEPVGSKKAPEVPQVPISDLEAHQQRMHELRDTAASREAREARETWSEERRARERAGKLHIGVPRLRTDIPRHDQAHTYRGTEQSQRLYEDDVAVSYQARLGTQGSERDKQLGGQEGRRQPGRLAVHLEHVAEDKQVEVNGTKRTERVKFDADTRIEGPEGKKESNGSSTNPVIELAQNSIAIFNGGENPITYPLSAFEQGVLEIPLSDNTSLVIEQPNGQTGELIVSTRVPEKQVSGDTIVLSDPMPLPEPTTAPEIQEKSSKETFAQRMMKSKLASGCIGAVALLRVIGASPDMPDEVITHAPTTQVAPPDRATVPPQREMTPSSATSVQKSGEGVSKPEALPPSPEEKMKEEGMRRYDYYKGENPQGPDSLKGLMFKVLADKEGEEELRKFEAMEDTNNEQYKKLKEYMDKVKIGGKGIESGDPTLLMLHDKVKAKFEPGGAWDGKEGSLYDAFKESVTPVSGKMEDVVEGDNILSDQGNVGFYALGAEKMQQELAK